MLVKEIMTKDVITVSPDTSVEAAANLMVKHGIGGLPVVDKQQKLIGIITESDFLGKRVDIPHGISSLHELLGDWMFETSLEEILTNARKRPVSEVMSTDLRLVHPETAPAGVTPRLGLMLPAAVLHH